MSRVRIALWSTGLATVAAALANGQALSRLLQPDVKVPSQPRQWWSAVTGTLSNIASVTKVGESPRLHLPL